MVKAGVARSDTHYTTPEQNTSKQPTITTAKLNKFLASRPLRDITYKLDPKKNPLDSLLTTLTRILECYDQTLKKVQSLDIDSQRVTKSSKTIQTTLEKFIIVFLSSNPM